jgi:tight adherence protein B
MSTFFMLICSALLFFGAGAILILLFYGDDTRDKSKKRLERLSQMAGKPQTDLGDGDPDLMRRPDKLIEILPPGMKVEVERLLSATGHQISLTTLAIIGFVSGLITFGFILVVVGAGAPWAFGVALIVMLVVPWQVLIFLVKRQAAKFIKLFPDAIDLIVRAVRAGLPVMGSLDAAGKETPDPVGLEFKKIIADIQIGVDFDDALRRASQRIRQVEFDFFTASLILQRESGGNLAETLETLSKVLRRRAELRAKTKAMTSEARTSAIVIGCLPLFETAALTIVNPGYIKTLVEDPRGGYIIGGGITLIALGALTMRALIRNALR